MRACDTADLFAISWPRAPERRRLREGASSWKWVRSEGDEGEWRGLTGERRFVCLFLCYLEVNPAGSRWGCYAGGDAHLVQTRQWTRGCRLTLWFARIGRFGFKSESFSSRGSSTRVPVKVTLMEEHSQLFTPPPPFIFCCSAQVVLWLLFQTYWYDWLWSHASSSSSSSLQRSQAPRTLNPLCLITSAVCARNWAPHEE